MGDAVTPKAGRTFNFSLTGDDLHLYETLRSAFEDEAEGDETKVSEALADLDPQVQALIKARMAPKSDKDLSHRQVFVRALTEALAARDAAADADEADGNPEG